MENPVLSQQVFESLALSNSNSSSSSSSSNSSASGDSLSASTDTTPPLSPIEDKEISCSPGLLVKSSVSDLNSTPKAKFSRRALHLAVPPFNQDAGYDSDQEFCGPGAWSMHRKVAKHKRAVSMPHRQPSPGETNPSRSDVLATPIMASFDQNRGGKVPQLAFGELVGLGLGLICGPEAIEVQQTSLPEPFTPPAICPEKPRLRPLIFPDSPSPILPLPCLQSNGTISLTNPPPKPLLMPTMLPGVISPIEEIPNLAMDIFPAPANARRLPDDLGDAGSPDPSATFTSASMRDLVHPSPVTVYANQAPASSGRLSRENLNNAILDDLVGTLPPAGAHNLEHSADEPTGHSAVGSAVLESVHPHSNGRKPPTGLGLGMPSSLPILPGPRRDLRALVHAHSGSSHHTCHGDLVAYETSISAKQPLSLQKYPKRYLYDIQEITPLPDVGTEFVMSMNKL